MPYANQSRRGQSHPKCLSSDYDPYLPFIVGASLAFEDVEELRSVPRWPHVLIRSSSSSLELFGAHISPESPRTVSTCGASWIASIPIIPNGVCMLEFFRKAGMPQKCGCRSPSTPRVSTCRAQAPDQYLARAMLAIVPRPTLRRRLASARWMSV